MDKIDVMIRNGTQEGRVLVLILGLLSTLLLAAAQESQSLPSEQARNTYKVQSNLVVVPVSVSDAGGKLIRDLSMRDFRVEEDGKAQILSGIAEPGRSRLELILVFDLSGSMNNWFSFSQKAAASFLRRITTPGDVVSLSTIGIEPCTVRPQTDDLGLILEDLCNLIPTRSATAFYDSIVAALRPVTSRSRTGIRRVQVVLSDGEDNYSTGNGPTEAIRALQEADCVFYAINPSGPTTMMNKIGSRGQSNLEALALQTGGSAFLPDAIEALPAIFDRIAAELQSQYVLEYYSNDNGGGDGFRNIVVRIPARPDLRIRARQGYYTMRS